MYLMHVHEGDIHLHVTNVSSVFIFKGILSLISTKMMLCESFSCF